ncbi:uncharacterized protein LOC125376118 [Haliotis rufescens]|uniref:uncharacterized protein LOC125376118 n=1 Tax=Haliotis rufescens TaxID=6454 RepID=UPI00201EBB32|nr:uncharacterized protein LOC125376118 [Haliotis rufescens]
MSDNISDLEADVRKWSWRYRIEPHYTFNESDLEFKVDIDQVAISYKNPTFSNYRKSPLTDPKIVFTTNYNNGTNDPQEVAVRVQRTTSATARIKMKYGVTADNGIGIKLRAPPEIDSVFGGYLPIKTEETSDLCHSMTWKYNSKITAAPRKTTVAKFEVNEERLVCDFSTYQRLKGKATVTVIHKVSRRTLETITEDIKTILDELLPDADETTPPENIIHIRNDAVQWPCRGEIDFTYGLSQNEVVE